jgi:acyl-CoA synthetase (AMP-forming)/AMP-acid ligase II
MNLIDAILSNADRRPDHPALEQNDRVVTYSALRDEVIDLAGRLREAGIDQGDLVGLGMGDTIGYVVAMLALFRLGAVLLPVDVRWTATEKANVLRAFGAATVLVDDPVDGLQTVRQIIPSDLPPDLSPDVLGAPGQSARPWPDAADLPLLLSLSSGTTGIPKGPRLTHAQFMMRLMAEWVTLGFASEDRFLCATPMYFGGARGFGLGHLLGGATVILYPPPYTPERLIAAIATTGTTSTFLVPTILRRLIAETEARPAPFPGLRRLISSGSALHPEERERLRRHVSAGFINLYASTEGGSISALMPDVEGPAALSAGRPALMSRFEIVDEQDRPLPPYEIGHIRQLAPWLPDGFFRNPEASGAAFRDGRYYPGDMGYVDEAGYLFITGRSKDVIKRGGINIYPDEIERVLMTHPAVAEAAVLAWPSREFGEEIAAFVVMSGVLEPDALRAHCRASLATYKIPRRFFPAVDIPKNSSGKVLKARLAGLLDPL